MLVKQCVCWEFVRKSIIVIEPQGCRCFYKTFLVSNNNLILYNILVVDTWEYWLTNVWYGNSKLSSEYLCILICIKNRNINKLFDTIKKKNRYIQSSRVKYEGLGSAFIIFQMINHFAWPVSFSYTIFTKNLNIIFLSRHRLTTRMHSKPHHTDATVIIIIITGTRMQIHQRQKPFLNFHLHV